MSLQIQALVNIVEDENHTRIEYSSGADTVYCLEDLRLGAKGNLKELQPGRRCKLVLGEQGESLYTYKTVLLDAKQKLGPFSYNCGVFIVPKVRAKFLNLYSLFLRSMPGIPYLCLSLPLHDY